MPEKPGSKRSLFSEQQEFNTTFKRHVMYFLLEQKKNSQIAACNEMIE
jgi:hypothetical protein